MQEIVGIINGMFIRENKNRFLCTVSIGGIDTVCYIPSSCRLDNFVNLSGQTVFLTPNKSKNTKTQWSIYAAKIGRQSILLNLSQVNKVIEEAIQSRRFSFLGMRKVVYREHTASGYRSDLYIVDTKTIIEVKSILTFNSTASFPSVFSERRIKQLSLLSSLLQQGYRVCYLLVSLNPKVQEIHVSTDDEAFFSVFQNCLDLGMIVRGVTVRLKNYQPIIQKLVPVVIDYPV